MDEEVPNKNSKRISSEIHLGIHFGVLPNGRHGLPFEKMIFLHTYPYVYPKPACNTSLIIA